MRGGWPRRWKNGKVGRRGFFICGGMAIFAGKAEKQKWRNAMSFAEKCYEIFERSVDDYHLREGKKKDAPNPFGADTLEYCLYEKNRVDSLQWHLEDRMRAPLIEPREALEVKRRIDALNQWRTALVEQLDDRFAEEFRKIPCAPDAPLNTESLGWALDRLSILAIRVYHMREESMRYEAGGDHCAECVRRLSLLLEQRDDLVSAIDRLRADVLAGCRRVKVYRQMKMYNDPDLNPVLYRKKKEE